MAAFKVRNLWTAFVTAFFALLASVGLTTAAAAASQPAARTPDEPVKARPQVSGAVLPAQSTRAATTRWLPPARDRSLPPTMKQRIGAEAHGASPATRHLPALEADAADMAEADAPAVSSAVAAAPAAAAHPTGSRRPARAALAARPATGAPAAAPVRSSYAVAA
ncbi:hypothetical protein QFZ82_004135 [Streptomyces sp. V4I23]|nr:DUF6344 domain-containing protein [Streptomyces sp. V4I23]MDQ1009650.1 hypothetical protein [Streptomyces sp. V4I23]